MQNTRLYLLYGSILSLAILVLLLVVKMYQPSLLDIDVKWLVVAAIPLLVALIAGKFITKIEGLGVSIEVAANEEINDTSVMVAAKTVKTVEKGSVPRLDELTRDEVSRSNVLVFTDGSSKYEADAVRDYLEKLPGVEYFAIVNEYSEFIGLKKLSCVELSLRSESPKLRFFLDVVEKRKEYTGDTTYTEEFTYPTDTVLEVLQKLRNSGKDIIAILNNTSERKLIGIVTECGIGRYLSTRLVQKANLLKVKPSHNKRYST